jgi:YD repeat-containing protein
MRHGPTGSVVPRLLRFNPATGEFSDTGVTLHFTEQFRADVGELMAVIPLGCVAPNAEGTADSYFFACAVANSSIPGDFALVEFDAATGEMVNAFWLANEDGSAFVALPGFWKFTGVEGGARTFLASVMPMTVQLKFAKPFMATVRISNPAQAVKMFGQPLTFGSTTIHAMEIAADSVRSLSEKGDLAALPGGGMDGSGVLISGASSADEGIVSLLFNQKISNNETRPQGSLQGDMGWGGDDERFNPLPVIFEALGNAAAWDMSVPPVSPSFAAPVTVTNGDQIAMARQINNNRADWHNATNSQISVALNEGHTPVPVGIVFFISIKGNHHGIDYDATWSAVTEELPGVGRVGVILDDMRIIRGAAVGEYTRLSGLQYNSGMLLRAGYAIKDGNNYTERVLRLNGVSDADIGKPVRVSYDHDGLELDCVSFICGEGKTREVYAGTDNLRDHSHNELPDWLGTVLRETRKGDIHIGWNILKSNNEASMPLSQSFRPVVKSQSPDYVALQQNTHNAPGASHTVTYDKDGATASWQDPNGANGLFICDDTTLVSGSGLPVQGGGGTDYSALDPTGFSCDMGIELPVFTADVIDPAHVAVELLAYQEPVFRGRRYAFPSIVAVALGSAYMNGKFYAPGAAISGIPYSSIFEFTPFEAPVAPDVPQGHVKVGEVVVLPDADSAPLAVRTEPDYSEATVSRADQFRAMVAAFNLAGDFRNLLPAFMAIAPLMNK